MLAGKPRVEGFLPPVSMPLLVRVGKTGRVRAFMSWVCTYHYRSTA
jgi:hypothetical protein